MDSFNPVIRCPYCNGVNRPSVTGWGRTGLNNRYHSCKHCNTTYTVVIYCGTSSETEISDGEIGNIKSKINYLKQKIREMRQNLINEHAKLAKEYIRLEASTYGKQN